MSTSAQTKMIAIVGTNGTGKTTLAKQIINSINVPRKLILTYQLNDWSEFSQTDLKTPADFVFEGTRWHIPIDVKESLSKLNYMFNSVLVLDDARNFIDDRTPPDLHRIYISRRQRGNHIIFIAHDLDDIPRKAYPFISDFVLFRCAPASEDRLKKLMDREAFEKAYQTVMQKSKGNRHYKQIISMI